MPPGHLRLSIYLSIRLSQIFQGKEKKILLPKNTSRRRRKPGWLSEPLELQKKKRICNLLVSLRRLQEKATWLHQSLAYTCTLSQCPSPERILRFGRATSMALAFGTKYQSSPARCECCVHELGWAGLAVLRWAWAFK